MLYSLFFLSCAHGETKIKVFMRFYMPACVICSFSIIIQHRACSERSLDWIYFGLCEIHSAKRYIADSKKDIIRSGGGGKEKDQDEG